MYEINVWLQGRKHRTHVNITKHKYASITEKYDEYNNN